MRRNLCLLAAAAFAVFTLAGTAAATGGNQPMTAFEKAVAQSSGTTLNFGMESDVNGFFALDADETQYWASVTGGLPVIRGTYVVDDKGQYHLDLASSVTATPQNLTITIRPDAMWYSPGHGTTPVTAADYAYTFNVAVDPRNPVATTAYRNFNLAHPYTIVNPHKIVFHFSTPIVDYKDLFPYVLPSHYLPPLTQMGANSGRIFNQVWRDCVCTQTVSGGKVVDGAPVSDGPFYMDAYTKGQGVVLKRTPPADWYGHSPALTQINFPIIAPGVPELDALRGVRIDAAAPAYPFDQVHPDPNLAYDVRNGFVQEHLELNQANPLLAHAWMRQAIALGLNRSAVIKGVYAGAPYMASSVKPLNNPVYETGANAGGTHAYFRTWNYDPAHALAILKSHCTGGPDAPSRTNTKIWTCPDGKASFDWYSTALDARVTSSQIAKAELMSIGIEVDTHTVAAGVLFGTILPRAQGSSCVTNRPCGNDTYDIAELAWAGSGDPSGWDSIYGCYDGEGGGAQNYKNYCNPGMDSLLDRAAHTFNPATRTALYEKVAKIVSDDAYIVPLYARPVILVYQRDIHGMKTSNNPYSVPTWNAEWWHF